MSPEQATGDRALDARADMYSLGAVAYEMLTGEPPYVGATAQAIIVRLMTETPRSVRATRPAVSPAMDLAIGRALSKPPARPLRHLRRLRPGPEARPLVPVHPVQTRTQ